MPKPVVAVVGRPNVGKSTFFNRIIGERKAIVESTSGVTRDRLYHDAEWNGREFTLIDTGGLDWEEQDVITENVRSQVFQAITQSDAVIFMVDSREGIMASDEEIASILRNSGKPVILVVNKVDNFKNNFEYMEFYQLGLGEPVPISALHGANTGNLLDRLTAMLPEPAEYGEEEGEINIAVAGRPNVGKSSLVNSLLGEDRVIVSHTPGTTRDAIDSFFYREGRSYRIVDTAGIRRKSRINMSMERYSVSRAFRAIEKCDVALILIDAVEGVTEQDKRIAGYAHECGKAVVFLVNKWDLVEKDDRVGDRYREHIRKNFPFMNYAPVLFISCYTGRGITKILNTVQDVINQASIKIETAQLNALVEDALLYNPPPAQKGKRLKIYYATQGGIKPPTFLFFVNDPGLAHFSYVRYLENQIRNFYGFEGTPVRMIFRRREREERS